MSEGAPQRSESEFKPYELIKPIEALGAFSYDANEDEISGARRKYEAIERKIMSVSAQFEEANKDGKYTTWNEYRDAKAYLEGRLLAVQSVLHEIDK